MDIDQKLDILTEGARFDRPGSIHERPTPPHQAEPVAPGMRGKSRLFQVLQSNECVYDCAFCPWRSGRETRRATIEPEALAETFYSVHDAGLADGLFLTSGVRESGVVAMDAMLKTADLLRIGYGYTGPLHLKVLPGAQRGQIQEAMRLADGVSINLEAPTDAHMSKISGRKRLTDDLLERMGWIRDLTAEFPVENGVSTQFVVGAAGESDRDLLDRTGELYRDYRLRRVLFAGFKPVWNTPLETLQPASAARMNRLSQADLLLRTYGIGSDEMAYGPDGRLSLAVDPKMAHALARPERFPIEVNTAEFEELLRVPGIGPLSARRLVSRRRERLIRDPREIALCGAVLKRAAPFLLLDGRAIGHLEQFIRQELRRSQTRQAIQLPLFEDN